MLTSAPPACSLRPAALHEAASSSQTLPLVALRLRVASRDASCIVCCGKMTVTFVHVERRLPGRLER